MMRTNEPKRPGIATRAGVRLLAALRDVGVPYLSGAEERDLRAFALGLRTGVRRTLAGPLDCEADAEPTISFTRLGEDDLVTLLPDNAEAFEVKRALVDGARRTLDCAMYYLADDGTGSRFADALVRAVRRGVRVRLAVDSHASQEKQFGPFGFGAAARGALALLARLGEAGVEVYETGTDRFCMHRKFLLADGERLLMGGRNVADHYASPGWRDVELLVEGPFVRAILPAVAATFESPTASAPAKPGIVLGVPGQRGRAFARAFEVLARRARSTVDIEHAYVLGHPWLFGPLRDAVRRGVRVRVLTNSAESNDLPFINWRVAVTLDELLSAGVEVYRRGGSGATLHTKLVVGDRRSVLFGSSNLDYYSPVYCAELDLAFESDALGEALATMVDRGIEDEATKRVQRDAPEHAALRREQRRWSVSRGFDLLLHDVQ
jgi:cardiolipin synthase